MSDIVYKDLILVNDVDEIYKTCNSIMEHYRGLQKNIFRDTNIIHIKEDELNYRIIEIFTIDNWLALQIGRYKTVFIYDIQDNDINKEKINKIIKNLKYEEIYQINKYKVGE